MSLAFADATPQQLLIPLMVALTVGCVLFVVAEPYLSGGKQADKRKAALAKRTVVAGVGRVPDGAKRRKQVADSLKEIENRAKNKKLSFEAKMVQAGLGWTRRTFMIVSAVLALVFAAVGYTVGGNLLMAVGAAVVGGLGLPKWFIGWRRKRRLSKFLDEFPAAVDIIVRGIKAGIPLGDCIRNISMEAAEPVKTEFKAIVDAQAMGISLSEAVERIVERVPTQEANFFSIVITIQQKAGGNLAEALANLSNVLRDRKKMKAKVKAMSSEAKASAGIIGALPPLVTFFVYLSSPAYIMLLFTTATGHMVLGVCAVWMGMGVMVMKKMVSFEI